jgi:ribonuclease HI
MWSLWRSRNDRHHGKVPIDPSKALEWAIDTCSELANGFKAATEGEATQVMRWRLPEDGHYKINVDGAFYPESNSGATGVVMRNSTGSLLRASARCLDSTGSALLAEAEAFRDGVRIIPEGTTDHIVLETDSQELVALWKNREKRRSEIKAIFDDVEGMISNLTSFQVVHTKRTANFAAHLCAQHAFSFLASFVWAEAPSFLQPCLQFDCNNTV